MALGVTGVSISDAYAVEPVGCAKIDTLDFWLGEWRVIDKNGNFQGANKIESRLNGCAIVETWSGVGGFSGMSLFSYDAREGIWRQTWVTENTSMPGGLKQKTQTKAPAGAVRFQGKYVFREDQEILDRTTLTSLPDGRIHQVIEISEDGEDWTITFEGFYERAN